MRKYISDTITVQQIEKWKNGQIYLIRSGTGSGKSFFVKNTLYDFAKENNQKILLFSNRNALKTQNQSDLGEEKLKVITPHNYQYFESMVLNNDYSIMSMISSYDWIILDEFHFVHLDSEFNRGTDIALEIIRNPPQDKKVIIMTATPDILLRYYSFPSENVYNIPTNYDYISNVFFYTKEQTPEAIIQNMPPDEKAIFFGNAEQAWELKSKFEDALFVCAKGNSKYYDEKLMAPVIKEISEKSMFSSRLLTTTKVLDNGINIIDADLKTIIIDTLNPITLIQELGRKRVLGDNDKINLYIRNQHRGNINFNLVEFNNGINKQLEDLAEFENMSREDFLKKYRKRDYSDVIDNDFNVNIAKKENLIYLKELYESLMKEKDSYKKLIAKLLDKNPSEFGNADMEIEKNNMFEYLEITTDVKMYKEEQEKFKQAFFNMIFSPKNTNYKHRGIRTINAVLEEDSLPFRISAGQDRKGTDPKKKETYWVVYRT